MDLCDVVAAVDEIARDGDTSRQIGMSLLNAGVDLSDAHGFAGCDLVHIGEVPGLCARLQRVKRIVVREDMS